MEEYDVIIVGGGPAGLSAGVYSGRYGLKTLVLEAFAFGGNVRNAHLVENYLGFKSISGLELAKLFEEHAKQYCEMKIEEVIDIKKENDLFYVKTNKNEYKAKAIILATGSKHRILGIKGEKEFKGRGVSYCSTCDGFLFRNKNVAVIGNGNGAASSVVYLQEICNKVYLITNNLKAEKSIIDKFKDNVEIINGWPKEIFGAQKVEGIILESGKKLNVDGVFISLGLVPAIELAKKLGVEIEKNYIKVNRKMETNIKGVFACGDITGINLQIAKAVGEGSIAGYSVFKYLHNLKR
jgi:thioredoxin reductase (NADPH)